MSYPAVNTDIKYCQLQLNNEISQSDSFMLFLLTRRGIYARNVKSQLYSDLESPT